MEDEKQTKQEIITQEEAEKMIEEDAYIRARNVRVGLRAIAILSTLIICGTGIIVVKNINRPKKSFRYKVDHDGKIQVSGRVKYGEVRDNWRLIEKELNNGESRLYIIDSNFWRGYVNVYTDMPIASGYNDSTVLNDKRLEPYLITYDMVYNSYTIEDIDWLLELIETDYEYVIPDESNKVMMKTNE